MASLTASGERERRLLAAAIGLSGVRRLDELLVRLRACLALDAGSVVGLALADEERKVWVHHLSWTPSGEVEVLELPAATLEPDGGRARRVPAAALGAPLAERLAARGLDALVRAPLTFGERRLGALFVAEPDGESVAGWEEDLADLARIVEPHAWNCVTEERFTRGDRRRDALRELGRVINTSLDQRTVLSLARTAIGSIEGHRASWIGLLEPGGTSWLRFDRPADPATQPEDPLVRPLAGSVLAHLAASGQTLESDDLERRLVFRGDEELRDQGVRRYVATPLRAGGKLLGAFLFGTDDPHPTLRIDLWLLENIALQVALAINNAQHHEELQRLVVRREQQNVYLREELRSEQDSLGMLGRSPAMQRVQDSIARVAGTESTVLIIGPTGVGKELVARAIHEASRRRDQPLVKLNCAAIPEGMVESELFGHERGAFTSAVDRRIGRFELAHNGTLFLDEIGELSPAVQAKLLRVLQSGEFERVGGSKTLASNARILAATNRDLAGALASGSFRSDLYYRLNVFPIEVPPLEERREDVPLLAEAFAEHFARRMGKRFEGLEPRSLERLRAHRWPGNVRELKHVVERAVILGDGPLLAIDPGPPIPAERAPAPAPEQDPLATLEEVEAGHLRAALERTGWVVEGPRGAAALLGLKGSTLRFRMKRLGIRRPDPR